MSRVGALDTSSFTKVHRVPHQAFRSLEIFLILLEKEPARLRVAEGDDIAFHNLGFESKIESKA